MKRRKAPYELDFVAKKCVSCPYYEASKSAVRHSLCWAKKCTKPPLMSDEEIKKRLFLGASLYFP